jgi:hypothetical protein
MRNGVVGTNHAADLVVLAIANPSILPSERVHAATSASVTSGVIVVSWIWMGTHPRHALKDACNCGAPGSLPILDDTLRAWRHLKRRVRSCQGLEAMPTAPKPRMIDAGSSKYTGIIPY